MNTGSSETWISVLHLTPVARTTDRTLIISRHLDVAGPLGTLPPLSSALALPVRAFGASHCEDPGRGQKSTGAGVLGVQEAIGGTLCWRAIAG